MLVMDQLASTTKSKRSFHIPSDMIRYLDINLLSEQFPEYS